MDERRSFRRPTTRAKLAKIRMLLSGSPKMGPTRHHVDTNLCDACTAGQKKNLVVVETRTFDFFNTRKVLYLSEKMD